MSVPSNLSDGIKLSTPKQNNNSQESLDSSSTVVSDNGRNKVNIDLTGKCPFRHGTVYGKK